MDICLQDLGARDLAREKVYLVCYVIRNGAMEAESNSKGTKNNITEYTVRRPFAVACYNLTPYFKNAIEPDEDKHHHLSLTP